MALEAASRALTVTESLWGLGPRIFPPAGKRKEKKNSAPLDVLRRHKYPLRKYQKTARAHHQAARDTRKVPNASRQTEEKIEGGEKTREEFWDQISTHGRAGAVGLALGPGNGSCFSWWSGNSQAFSRMSASAYPRPMAPCFLGLRGVPRLQVDAGFAVVAVVSNERST